MGQRQSYSSEFKAAIVSKIMNRGDDTIESVCEAEGVNFRSASNWLRAHGSSSEMKKKTRTRKRSGEEKLKACFFKIRWSKWGATSSGTVPDSAAEAAGENLKFAVGENWNSSIGSSGNDKIGRE